MSKHVIVLIYLKKCILKTKEKYLFYINLDDILLAIFRYPVGQAVQGSIAVRLSIKNGAVSPGAPNKKRPVIKMRNEVSFKC